MIKKKVIILFFSMCLANIFADNNLLIDSYNNSSAKFYTKGIITNSDGKTSNITIYKEKNRDNFFDISILIDSDLFQNSSKELNEVYFKNNFSNNNSTFYENLPLELLNLGFRNRDFTILETSASFKFKGLKTNKLLSVEKEYLEEITELTNNINIGSNEVLLVKYTPEENITLAVEIKENTSEIEITEDITETIILENESLNNDYLEIEDKNKQEELPQLEQEAIPEIEKNIFEKSKFEKIIYLIGEDNNIILKKEIYLNKTDRNPQYTIESNTINFIQGYYVITEYLISDIKQKKEYILKLDTKTISFSDIVLNNSEKEMSNFYRVK